MKQIENTMMKNGSFDCDTKYDAGWKINYRFIGEIWKIEGN